MALQGFLSCSDGDIPMKLKDLIGDLSQETGVPASQVRKLTKALASKLQTLIEQQDSLRVGDLVFKAVTVPAKPASEGKEPMPQRKIARLSIRPRKPKAERGGRQRQQVES